MVEREDPSFGMDSRCVDCGACCHVGIGINGFPPFREAEDFGQREEISHIANRDVKLRVLALEGRLDHDATCVMFDPQTKLCTIWAERPDACREEFGIGSPECLNARLLHGNGPLPDAPDPPGSPYEQRNG